MTDNDEKRDLSSLIEVPGLSADPATATPTPDPDSQEPAQSPTEAPSEPHEPIQFESLEEFSHETVSPQASEEVAPSGLDMSLVDLPQSEPSESVAVEPLPTELASEPAPEPGIDSIKKFSENLATAEPQVAASFPFSLKIEGKLAPEDAEKLISLLTRENMGFREVDLEPQIAEGRILIPRISEYAGVLLLQALRSVPARISFGPSDEIFSTPETRSESGETHAGAGGFSADGITTEWTRADWEMPVTNADTLPQFAQATVLDTLVASGLLTTRAVEAASSEEYEVLLEALIRELRYKAQRRGANGILALRVQLTPLTLPTDYRVTVTGTAVLGTP